MPCSISGCVLLLAIGSLRVTSANRGFTGAESLVESGSHRKVNVATALDQHGRFQLQHQSHPEQKRVGFERAPDEANVGDLSEGLAAEETSLPAEGSSGAEAARPWEESRKSPFWSASDDKVIKNIKAKGDVHHVTASQDAALDLEATNPLPRVFVNHVDEDGWATQHGIRAGDEIIKVDGQEPGFLNEKDFAATLKKRPLNLEIFKKAYWNEGDKVRLTGAENELHGSGTLVAYSEDNHKWDVLLGTGQVIHVANTNFAPLDSTKLRQKHGVGPVGAAGNLEILERILKDANIDGAKLASAGEQEKLNKLRETGMPLSEDRRAMRSTSHEIGLYSTENGGPGSYWTAPLIDPGAKRNLPILRHNTWMFLREASWILNNWDYTKSWPSSLNDASLDNMKQELSKTQAEMKKLTGNDDSRQVKYAKDWMAKTEDLELEIEEEHQAAEEIDAKEEAGNNKESLKAINSVQADIRKLLVEEHAHSKDSKTASEDLPQLQNEELPATPIMGRPGARIDYSGLMDMGHDLKKSVGQAATSLSAAIPSAEASVGGVNKLLVEHRNLRDTMDSFRKARVFMRDHLRDRHKNVVSAARKALSRNIAEDVVGEAAKHTRLALLSPIAKHTTPDGNRKWWADLSDAQKTSWERLGWSEVTWDRDLLTPVTAKEPWGKLTPQQRDAANKLGFTEQTWRVMTPVPGAHLVTTKANAGVGDQSVQALSPTTESILPPVDGQPPLAGQGSIASTELAALPTASSVPVFAPVLTPNAVAGPGLDALAQPLDRLSSRISSVAGSAAPPPIVESTPTARSDHPVTPLAASGSILTKSAANSAEVHTAETQYPEWSQENPGANATEDQ